MSSAPIREPVVDSSGDVSRAWLSYFQGLDMDSAALAQPGDVKLSYATLTGSWLLANGQTVSRTGYAALFKVLGTTYGAGDGSTTFALPNTTSKTTTDPQTWIRAQ